MSITPPILTDIPSTIFENLNEYYKIALPKETYGKGFQCVSRIQKKVEHAHIVKTILNYTETILRENNITNVSTKNFLIEFHHYYKETNEVINMPFCIHCDDYAGVKFKTYTIIYYLEKSPTLLGGDLLYILDGEEDIHTVENGKMIIMHGSIEHMITDFNLESSGYRKSIVCQIKRLDK